MLFSFYSLFSYSLAVGRCCWIVGTKSARFLDLERMKFKFVGVGVLVCGLCCSFSINEPNLRTHSLQDRRNRTPASDVGLVPVYSDYMKELSRLLAIKINLRSIGLVPPMMLRVSSSFATVGYSVKTQNFTSSESLSAATKTSRFEYTTAGRATIAAVIIAVVVLLGWFWKGGSPA